jgi:serine/threonine protein kinase
MELGEGSLFDALYVAQIPAFKGRKGEAPHMSEDDARFYFSELCLGVQHIHALGYCYRDMKLENCLVDKRGHVRVADFDQSAKLEDMAAGTLKKTLVGTPEYMAPEIIKNLHEDVVMGKGIDVWAMGVLLFELIHGRTPFSRRHPQWTTRDTYTEIIYGEPFGVGKLAVLTKSRQPRSTAIQEKVTLRKMQIHKSGLQALLLRMLVKQAEERITLDEVCVDPWMRAVDWSSVKDRMVEPPHRPDRSAGARQRKRRRSVTKMLESDSLQRPNWEQHARTSLQNLKPGDLMHHTNSADAVEELQAQEQQAQQEIPCELQDPTSIFAGDRNNLAMDRQKVLEAESEALRATPMTGEERRLEVMYEDEKPNEEGDFANSDSDTAGPLAQ